MEVTRERLPRKLTYPILVVPVIVVVVFTNVTAAVAIASRVFAFYVLLQAAIAAVLARRRHAWAHVAGFVAIGLAMAVIMVFGLPT